MACGDRRRLTPAELRAGERTPRCSSCPNGLLRPDVVLFEEMLPAAKLARIRVEFYDRMPDLVLVCGTSALFPYIVEPVVAAAQHGKLTVCVDPAPTSLSDLVDFSLRATAGRALPAIAEAIAHGR